MNNQNAVATIQAPHAMDYIVELIQSAQQNAMRKVNEELIRLYYSVGQYLHEEGQKYSYGDKFIDDIALLIAQNHPEIKGFNKRGLYRMKQFYQLYQDD